LKKIQLLLIEDNSLLRKGYLSIFESYPYIEIINVYEEGKNIFNQIRQLKPDLVLLDLGFQSQNSFSIVQKIGIELPDVKIILMDLFPLQSDISKYAKAGVSGFILKDASINDFISTIHLVAKGKKVLPPLMSDSLFAQIVKYAIKEVNGKLKRRIKMTKRERKITELLSESINYNEIGQEIQMSTYNVKSHIHNILEKLMLHMYLEAADYYTDNSLNEHPE
jgi:DNA-binding NarL/FixJ family response regulator